MTDDDGYGDAGSATFPLVEGVRHFRSGARRGTAADGERYDLMSPQAIRRYAAVMAEGASKYDDHNWRKGIPQSVMVNHALRHLVLWMEGDRTEDHLGHALWNVAGMIENEEVRPDLDDRYSFRTDP